MKRTFAVLAFLVLVSTPIVAAQKIRIVRGDGISTVSHDSTLRGSGTSASPLGVTPFLYISTLNGKSGNVNITAGQGLTIVPTSDGFAIASSLAGGTAVSSVNGLTGPITLSGANGLSI